MTNDQGAVAKPASDEDVIALFRRAVAAAEHGDEKAEMVARWMASLLLERAAASAGQTVN